MHTREEVTRYLYWDVMTEDELRDTLDRKLRRVTIDKEGDALNPAAVLRETGELVGDGALFYKSEEHRTGEVGFILKPEFNGRGLRDRDRGRAAAGRLRGHAASTASSAAATRATPGRAQVMERLGMRREAHLVQNEWVKGEWCDELDYALLADEWRAQRADQAAAGTIGQ